MTILMLLAGRDFPPDIRVEKEVRSLTAAGHDVVLACDRRTARPERDCWNGATVVRVPVPGRAARPWVRTRELMLHDSPRWKAAATNLVEEFSAGAIHVHDLPMLGTALAVGRAKGIPVVVDFHENYPAMVRIPGRSDRRGLGGTVLPLLHRLVGWERFEKRCAVEADHVIVVVEEAKERLIRLGVPEERISVVGNTVDRARFGEIAPDEDILGSYDGDFVVSYIGGFTGTHRGLETVVDAMVHVVPAIPNVRLLLVGDGANRSELERRAARLGVDHRITFTGWQPFEVVPSYIARSAVCLVPHASFDHTESTIPHKLFQYMWMKRPVVVSSCRPLKRIVEETGAGLVFEAGDADALARCITSLADDDLRERLGRAGRDATESRYNWDVTKETLLGVYAAFPD